ncbi:MAG: type II toxin-antitoxin system HipA family toxin [Paludibacteraceae bacterium]|nr:type II toxin-antitoxin system HipA family toxin [Paludibacteraceae bacterium]
MTKIYVYADFNWLKKVELVGELSMQSIRGKESYSFEFSKEWLKNYGSIQLSDDINNYTGIQYCQQNNEIFGCFADSLPDRWGRTLILRREQILAMEEKRPVRRLTEFDFLTGIDDYTRIGGFRYKIDPTGEFINTSNKLQIPPITEIKELVRASNEIELSEEKNTLPQKKWLFQLIQPGTSLGGARPKATIIDENKHLYIAKFPSRNDLYDVGLWEHLSHLLAKESGLNCSESKVIKAGNKYHTLLSKRFDRTADNKRIHYASAMTMLGLKDGCNANTGNGYLDIVNYIIKNCCNVDYNLKELYRRVAFNISIGNSDDHFRNHGFLLTPQGWTLSPAFDINPSLSKEQSLLINSYTSKSDLNILLDSCEEYMLNHNTAKQIIEEVLKGISKWKLLANKINIPQSEQNIFKDRFITNIPK